MIPTITGFDIVSAVLDITLGRQLHYDGNKINKYIVDEFLYCNPGIFDHLEGFEQLKEKGVMDHYDQFKTSGHVFDNIKSSGDRVAYFSISADTYQELAEKHSMVNSCIRAYDVNGVDLIRHDIIRLTNY